MGSCRPNKLGLAIVSTTPIKDTSYSKKAEKGDLFSMVTLGRRNKGAQGSCKSIFRVLT